MQITYIGHACLLVEAGGKSLIMDPWLEDPAYCNTWYHYPPLVHTTEELLPTDYVWCSHDHPDHFDRKTLAKVPKDQEFLVPGFTSGDLERKYRQLGFERLTPMPFGETMELAPDFQVTCLRSDLVWEDSAILVQSQGVTLFNMNDCKLGDDLLAEVRERYRPDIVFVPFSGAIHFPTCYEYSDEERRKLCAGRKRKHLEAFVSRVELLGAKTAVPFAGNFALLHDDQMWMNEPADNNINTPDEAIALLAEKAPQIEGLQMNPGDRWTPTGGLVRHAPPPNFVAKMEQVRAMNAAEQPRLTELRAAEPPARATLRADTEAYFRRIADHHPELMGRIDSNVVFDCSDSPHGGVWRLRFDASGFALSDFGDGDPWDMRMTIPATILQQVIDDEICWDEVAISFRLRFAENPEYFNQSFWVMLYKNQKDFLDEYLANANPKYS